MVFQKLHVPLRKLSPDDHLEACWIQLSVRGELGVWRKAAETGVVFFFQNEDKGMLFLLTASCDSCELTSALNQVTQYRRALFGVHKGSPSTACSIAFTEHIPHECPSR